MNGLNSNFFIPTNSFGTDSLGPFDSKIQTWLETLYYLTTATSQDNLLLVQDLAKTAPNLTGDGLIDSIIEQVKGQQIRQDQMRNLHEDVKKALRDRYYKPLSPRISESY